MFSIFYLDLPIFLTLWDIAHIEFVFFYFLKNYLQDTNYSLMFN